MSQPVIVDLPAGFPKEATVTLKSTGKRGSLSAPFEWGGEVYTLCVPTHHPNPIKDEVWVVEPWSLNLTEGYVYAPAKRRVSTKSGKPLLLEAMEEVGEGDMLLRIRTLLTGYDRRGETYWADHSYEGALQSICFADGAFTVHVGKVLHRVERDWNAVGVERRTERRCESLVFTCKEESANRLRDKFGKLKIMCSREALLVVDKEPWFLRFGESYSLEFKKVPKSA
jgi:hypothetical protein